MSAHILSDSTVAHRSIPFFERYLTVWVGLCIVAGVALGQMMPGVFETVSRMELARVNVPVGLLIWVMIIPMLVKIDFGALHQVKDHWRGIGSRCSSTGPSSPFRWRCSAGSSFGTSSRRICPPTSSTVISPA